MDEIYVASGTGAMVAAVLLQVLKRSEAVSWIRQDTGKLNAALGALLAMLSAAGVSYTFDFNQETGDMVANVHLNVWTVLHWLEHAAAQWGAQQGIFWGLIRPGELLGELVPVMREIRDRQRATSLGGF